MRGLMADTKPIHDQCVNAQTFTHTLLDLPGKLHAPSLTCLSKPPNRLLGIKL